MPRSDLPDGTANEELSFNDGVNDITGILTGLEDDVLNPGGDKPDDGDDGDSEASDEDQLQLDDEDQVEDEEEDPSSDDERPARGGEFVPDTGKVTLDDGTVLSVADLKRNNLFHQDYTRKTMELSEERKTLQKDREFVGQHAAVVVQERQVMAAFIAKHLPQPPTPEMAKTDPYGYNIARAEYEARFGEFNQLVQTVQQTENQQRQQYQAQLDGIKYNEAVKLFDKLPSLRDQQKFAEWYSEAGGLVMEKYGFTADEVNDATDHRFYLMMNDLRRLHNALDKTRGNGARSHQRRMPPGNKPRILAGSNRNTLPMNSGQKQRQVFGERLRKTGSIEDAVRKLSTFEL